MIGGALAGCPYSNASHQSWASPWICSDAYNTFCWSSHYAMLSFFSTARSQSSASSRPVAWENTGGWPFKNSPRLSRGAPPPYWFYWFCTNVCMSCVCIAKSCSIVSGGGGCGGTPPRPRPLPLPDICLSNIQNLYISRLEYILKIFWMSLNISSSVKQ